MSKRQLTLAEALKVPSSPVAKKPRLSSPASPPRSQTATTVLSAAAPPMSAAAASAPSFSLDAYKASLSTAGSDPTEADLLRLECETLDRSWLSLLKDEIRKPYFRELKAFLWKEGLRGTQDKDQKGKLTVFPPARDVYSWSRYTPLENVKVVILGQDPYHNDGSVVSHRFSDTPCTDYRSFPRPDQAHGLCFSVRPGVKIPPSLRNIYKEIKEEYPSFEIPKHGSLTSLARSGVLLLNTSLTVKPHQAGAHSGKGWETFTDKLVDLVDKYGGSGEVGKEGEGVVVFAWGAWAAKRVAKMDKKKHLILTSPHPSPLSARRGFFGNGHFRKANEWLETKYGPEAKINWTKIEIEEETEQEKKN
ncbi:uracil-DNA glycosylase [Sporobolomyces koalae]|uniref:uracil-DNA glycosylase n=1 Tax=Sporobolomyces koalae TaxID=500713 RepID=UPI00316DA6E2